MQQFNFIRKSLLDILDSHRLLQFLFGQFLNQRTLVSLSLEAPLLIATINTQLPYMYVERKIRNLFVGASILTHEVALMGYSSPELFHGKLDMILARYNRLVHPF